MGWFSRWLTFLKVHFIMISFNLTSAQSLREFFLAVYTMRNWWGSWSKISWKRVPSPFLKTGSMCFKFHFPQLASSSCQLLFMHSTSQGLWRVLFQQSCGSVFLGLSFWFLGSSFPCNLILMDLERPVDFHFVQPFLLCGGLVLFMCWNWY